MKKRILTSLFVLGLAVLVSLTVYPQFVDAQESSDPFQSYYELAKPEITPPLIQFSSSQNNSVIDSTSFTLVFNVSVPQVVSAPKNVEVRRSELNYVFYQSDWLTEKHDVYGHNYVDVPSSDGFFEFTVVVSNISEGTHRLLITAHGTIGVNAGVFGFDYHSESNDTIVFTVNTNDSTHTSQDPAFKYESVTLLIILIVVAVSISVGLLIGRKRLGIGKRIVFHA